MISNAISDPVRHLVCQCNSTWGSIPPAPPCPYHAPQAYNGLCNCPAQFGLHPIHLPSVTSTTTTLRPFGQPDDPEPYEGRHRKP